MKTVIQVFEENEDGDSFLNGYGSILGFWRHAADVMDGETPSQAMTRAMSERMGEHHSYRAYSWNDIAPEDEVR